VTVIIIELRRPTRDDNGYAIGSRVVTRVRADGAHIDIDGEERDLDFEQRVLSLRDGRLITPRDSAEEWVRGLVATYRSPYLWAEIVEDTNPVEDLDVAPVEVEEPVENLEPALR
jgi:hypothetical protein